MIYKMLRVLLVVGIFGGSAYLLIGYVGVSVWKGIVARSDIVQVRAELAQAKAENALLEQQVKAFKNQNLKPETPKLQRFVSKLVAIDHMLYRCGYRDDNTPAVMICVAEPPPPPVAW